MLSQELAELDYGQAWIEELNQFDMCDIELTGDPRTDFIGFTEIYRHLSEIIPLGRTVIDLGCAYAPQAYYFRKHKRYIGVDVSDCPKLKTPNSTYFQMSIAEFVESQLLELERETIFAICSYVPPWGADNASVVKGRFDNCFVFYPSRKDHPEWSDFGHAVRRAKGR